MGRLVLLLLLVEEVGALVLTGVETGVATGGSEGEPAASDAPESETQRGGNQE